MRSNSLKREVFKNMTSKTPSFQRGDSWRCSVPGYKHSKMQLVNDDYHGSKHCPPDEILELWNHGMRASAQKFQPPELICKTLSDALKFPIGAQCSRSMNFLCQDDSSWESPSPDASTEECH